MRAPLFNTLMLSSALASASAFAIDLRVDNVKLYQPTEKRFSAPQSIYIENGVIVDIHPATTKVNDAKKTIDAKGQFAVPGLMDLHVHLGASGSNFTEFQYLPVEAHFNANLYLGVTSLVDLFSFKMTLDEAAVLKQQQVTPELFYAGTLFTNPGGHGTQFGGQAYTIEKDSDIEGLWQKHMATKPHVTKAVIESFGGHGATLTDSQLKELGRRSKAEGLPYFVHVSTLDDGKRAIRAGATALAHGINDEAIDEEFITLLKTNKVTYIPTLAVYHNHTQEKEHQHISSQTNLMPVVHDKLRSCLFDQVPTPSKWRQATWDKRSHAYQNIIKVHKAGVTIGAGSDAGNPYTLHGLGLHNEIDALAVAGLSNAEIINAATINGAKTLGVADTQGKLKVGYQASFILLDNNPLNDIEAIHHINQVFKSGQQINREQLATKNQAISPVGKACNQQVDSTTAAKVIDDFSGDKTWLKVTDTMMGGQSSAELTMTNNALTIKTKLGKPTGFGAWAGSELKFSQAVDASKFNGIQITYKGSTTPFSMSVYHSKVQDWDHFSKALPASEDWTTVDVKFSELKQFGFGTPVTWTADSITGVNFMWRSFPGAPTTSANNEFQLKSIAYF